MGIGTAPSLSSNADCGVRNSEFKPQRRVLNSAFRVPRSGFGRRWRDARASVAPVATGLASGGRERYWVTERLTTPTAGNATGTGGDGAQTTPPPASPRWGLPKGTGMV